MITANKSQDGPHQEPGVVLVRQVAVRTGYSKQIGVFIIVVRSGWRRSLAVVDILMESRSESFRACFTQISGLDRDLIRDEF